MALCLGSAVLPSALPAAGGGPDASLQTTAWVDLRAGSRMRLVAIGGSKVIAGVEIQLADGWKTYWRMPGDAGVPPQFEWQGSGNVASVRVLYPAPQRLMEPAAETIGYKHTVVFPVEAAAKDATRPVDLKLEMDFGLCKDICVPVQTSLALSVAPAGKAVPVPPLLASALALVPRVAAARRATDPEVVRTDARLDGTSPRLAIDAKMAGGGKGADLFIEAPDGIYVPLPKRAADAPDGTLRFEVALSAGTAKDLRGKTLTLTLVSDAGAVETPWTLP